MLIYYHLKIKLCLCLIFSKWKWMWQIILISFIYVVIIFLVNMSNLQYYSVYIFCIREHYYMFDCCQWAVFIPYILQKRATVRGIVVLLAVENRTVDALSQIFIQETAIALFPQLHNYVSLWYVNYRLTQLECTICDK